MIDILMSTFNGAEFIGEQIDSILAQDFVDFRLIIRDDGSTDSTLEIVRDYCKLDGRVQIAEDELGSIGASRSFLRLLELSAAEFFMLADQDDVGVSETVLVTRRAIGRPAADAGNAELGADFVAGLL